MAGAGGSEDGFVSEMGCDAMFSLKAEAKSLAGSTLGRSVGGWRKEEKAWDGFVTKWRSEAARETCTPRAKVRAHMAFVTTTSTVTPARPSLCSSSIQPRRG